LQLAAYMSCIERPHSIACVGDSENDGTTEQHVKRIFVVRHGMKSTSLRFRDARSIAVSILLKSYTVSVRVMRGVA